MPMQGTFDANQYAPKQAGTTHPIGKFPATISNTSIEPTKDGQGGMFIVEFTTQAGSISQRYNLWNQSEKAVQIAHGQLSALCHATGVFKLQWENDGAALRNGKCQIEVVEQIDKETKQPNGYTQVAKVYDVNGDEPGKPKQQAQVQPQQPAQQPQQWANGPQNGAQQAPQSPSPAWGHNPPGQQPAPQQAPQGWQPGPNVAPAGAPQNGNPPPPPWASR